ETVGDERRRLQSVAGDEQDDAVVLTQLAAANGLAQRTERGRRCGLAEDARRLGEKLDVLRDLVFRDDVDPSPRLPRSGDGEIAVRRASDRDRARDRVRPYRLDAAPVGKGGRHRSAPLRLAADDARPLTLDEPELEQLAEAA